jgi:acetyl-CoA carboxylase biotin carboxylase subunit
MTSAAAAVGRAAGYSNAGTIEFLLDEDQQFYFLEMNTRLQVEHPITEMVTGLDLVRWQMRIARGERLTFDPAQAMLPRGHAMECRIYAEDSDRNFLPSPGRITQLRAPSGPGVRDDSGVSAGLDVPIFYDPLISKLVSWAEDRPAAIARMRRALDEYLITGIKTTVPFFRWLLAQPELAAGRFHTTYLDELLVARAGRSFTSRTVMPRTSPRSARRFSRCSRWCAREVPVRPPAEPAHSDGRRGRAPTRSGDERNAGERVGFLPANAKESEKKSWFAFGD